MKRHSMEITITILLTCLGTKNTWLDLGGHHGLGSSFVQVTLRDITCVNVIYIT